jgi:hypothetical protein
VKPGYFRVVKVRKGYVNLGKDDFVYVMLDQVRQISSDNFILGKLSSC